MLFRKNKLNHKGTVNLTTKRFLLRKFEKKDAGDVYNNWTSHEEAARYNAWTVHDSINVTAEYLSEWIKSYEKTNYYNWAITDKYTGEVLGSISVSNVKDKKLYCEIGYTVSGKYWNQGIATEVLIEVINFLSNEVGFKNITALHDVRNKASGRVMEKAGMTYEKNKLRFFLGSDKIVVNCCVYKYIR